MKRFSSIRPAVLLLVLAASAAPAYAQEVTLRYRWTKGESVTYRMTNLTNSAISGMPGQGNVTFEQSITQVLKVTAEDVAADGAATLRQTFESVRMEMKSPVGRIVYDSSAPEKTPNPVAEMMGKVMGALVGESIIVVMSPVGEVRRVEGASRILEKVIKSTLADPASASAAQGLKAMLSDDALKSTLGQSFSKLPAGPVKPGDTWNGQLAMGSEAIGRVTGTSTFTLKSIEGTADAQVARIAVGLALKQEVLPAPSGPVGMVMKIADGKGEGEILFIVARGRIQRSTMRSELPSTMTMTGPDGSPVTMQNRTTTTMTMELVEK
jgi:hypothetical protein